MTPEQIAALVKGNPMPLLHPGQQRGFVNLLQHRDRILHVWDCGRGFGKSYALAATWTAFAYLVHGGRFGIAVNSMGLARETILPHLKALWNEIPAPYAPHWNGSESTATFPNGSQIALRYAETAGGGGKRQIGQDWHSFAVDEAARISNGSYLIDIYTRSVLPRIKPGGLFLVASTPPDQIDHPWADRFIPDAKAAGTYMRFTSFDNPHRPHDMLYRAIAETLRRDDFPREPKALEEWLWHERRDFDAVTVLREYFCVLLPNPTGAVFPEWDPNLVIRAVERPRHWERHMRYVVLDVGYDDRAVALFCYYDWVKAQLVVEREWSKRHASTDMIAEAVRSHEVDLWGAPGTYPVRRVTDVDPRLVADLGRIYALPFSQVQKGAGSLHAGVNAVRDWIRANRISIDPSCTQLASDMPGCTWNTARTDWTRPGSGGHYDAAAALMYAVRSVDTQTCPVPQAALAYNPIVMSGPGRAAGPTTLNDLLKSVDPRTKRVH